MINSKIIIFLCVLSACLILISCSETSNTLNTLDSTQTSSGITIEEAIVGEWQIQDVPDFYMCFCKDGTMDYDRGEGNGLDNVQYWEIDGSKLMLTTPDHVQTLHIVSLTNDTMILESTNNGITESQKLVRNSSFSSEFSFTFSPSDRQSDNSDSTIYGKWLVNGIYFVFNNDGTFQKQNRSGEHQASGRYIIDEKTLIITFDGENPEEFGIEYSGTNHIKLTDIKGEINDFYRTDSNGRPIFGE